MAEFKQSILNIAEICAQKKITDFILSPGSRSAPLCLAFLRHPKLTCKTVVDERSAAFIAMGIAQQTGQPVGVVCTSGTAVLNYAPAIAEAYYQKIPLLIFTADRPPEWIDQNDNQTINQREIYGKHGRASFELPVDDSPPDAKWHIERIISDAINKTQWPVPGPVQVNVPLREPLYPTADFEYKKEVKTISVSPTRATVDHWQELKSEWEHSPKKLIIAGMHQPDLKLAESLDELQQKYSIPVLCDITSNMQAIQNSYFDMTLASGNQEMLQELSPDLLISFGGPHVSKSLKLFLRKFKPKHHWQIQPHFDCIDTFQSLTRIIPVEAQSFFAELIGILEKSRGTSNQSSGYYLKWQDKDQSAKELLETFLKETPFCEMAAMALVLKFLPKDSHLQLGNSSIVRWANYLGLRQTVRVKVNSNRGTSGIDGTVSTAVGAAMSTDKITTLIVGDLGFFYDRNGLWHDHLPPNLRIIIFNNYGGGIFRILDGSKDMPELHKHFETGHSLNAENTAEDHGLEYQYCDSKESLTQCLPSFFQPKKRPAILEVRFDKIINAEAFFKFKSMTREIK